MKRELIFIIVFDFCLELGIEPWITLYHWDLPFQLHLNGGWSNREIINWFSDYVSVCIKAFGDRVKNWIVLNEPMVLKVQDIFWAFMRRAKKVLHNFYLLFIMQHFRRLKEEESFGRLEMISILELHFPARIFIQILKIKDMKKQR